MKSLFKYSALIAGTCIVVLSQVISAAPTADVRPPGSGQVVMQVVKGPRRRFDLPDSSIESAEPIAPRPRNFRQHIFWFLQSINQQIGHGQWAMAIRRSHLFREGQGPRPARQEEIVMTRERRRRIHSCRHD